ncbi:hypothetical protein SDC9_199405 [bioreactor metagenome]|uniref:Uncharacterized protein n=1 Tax=bioreactor metagenome TaxID=1076179 RepID=A0A645IL58_9ZZZZ
MLCRIHDALSNLTVYHKSEDVVFFVWFDHTLDGPSLNFSSLSNHGVDLLLAEI